MSFGQKTAGGLAWNLIETVANYASLFVIGIILARLLSPTEFGIIGILSIFLSVFDSIVDCGFSNALIRKTKVEGIDYDTIFIFNICVSIILYFLFFVGSPLISIFFNDVSLTGYARLLGIVIIINAFSVVQRTILTKAINFKRQALVTISATLISGSVGVTMAYLGYGVWSLVWQSIVKQSAITFLFWYYGNWYPKFRFSYPSFKEMFIFGWKVLASGMISTIWAQIYTFVIGKVYSKETLGLYSRGQQFTGIFTISLTAMIRKVTYPAFCSVQENEPEMILVFRKILRLMALLSWSALFVLASIAEPMVLTLLGEKWIGCIPYLQLLCFCGLSYSVGVMNLNMLQVKGRSDYFLYVEIISKVIGIVPLLIGIFVGIMEMLYTSIFINLIMYVVDAWYCSKVIDYPLTRQIKDMIPQLFIPFLLAIVVYIIGCIGLDSLLTLVVQLFCAAFLFFVLIKKIYPEDYQTITSVVEKIKRR